MTSTPPNTVRIKSLSTWSHCFHPTNGIFRLPNEKGASIEHLEIDLRYVDESCFDPNASTVYLPNVCILTLRGGEYCQEDDERMNTLAEILVAVNPIEVRWLHASEDLAEQFSYSTHLVHHDIISAGYKWAQNGLNKLIIQGGFPCPNLTPPTPFEVTPATTPCPSPGPRPSSFASSLPALSTTKPKPIDEVKLKERNERKRIADYALKPRFEYAFGSWGAEDVRWRLDGRYTPAAIVSIITKLFQALAASYPAGDRKNQSQIPSLFAFSPVPISIYEQLQALPSELQLSEEVIAYLEDVIFITVDDHRFARLFPQENDDRSRLTRRMKAEMILAGKNGAEAEIVPLSVLAGANGRPPISNAASPAFSYVSLEATPFDTDGETDNEAEAVTPDLHHSAILELPIIGGNGKGIGLRSGGSSGVDLTEQLA